MFFGFRDIQITDNNLIGRYSNHPLAKIDLVGCLGSNVLVKNNILFYSSQLVAGKGIEFHGASDAEISCNYIENFRQGIIVSGNCMDASLQRNTIEENAPNVTAQIGLRYLSGSVTGDQEHHGNT